MCLSLFSPTIRTCSREQGHYSCRDPATERSCDSPISRHGVGVGVESVSPGQHEYDPRSDCNSLIEVETQKVVIIAPPVPETKRKRCMEKMPSQKDVTRKSSSKTTEMLRKPRAVNENVFSSKVNDRRKKMKAAIDVSGYVETEDGAIAGASREEASRDAPSVSAMDILVASALGLASIPLKVMKSQGKALSPSSVDEDASLDTADSSIQANCSFCKRGELAPRNCRATELHCRSERSSRDRNQSTVNQGACLSCGSIGSFQMDRQTIRGDNHAGYSSANQDIRVVTLEKHLKNAGCLKRWLCSLGLGQFKEVFDKKIWTARDLLGFK